MKKKEQEIYINIDDSGKLTPKEHISVYAGVVFLSKLEKDKFITQYRSIVNEIKCKYCKNKENCNNECPEIKNTNIKNSDKRRIMNYVKKNYIVALIVRNDSVYKHIINNKAAKGRFMDYAIRRLIKEVIKEYINTSEIDPYKQIRLVINIDQQITKNNGYYSLKEGLLEELRYGITNFNYASKIKPIIHADIEIILTYQDSKRSYLIQAADLLAGTVRRKSLDNENITPPVDYKIYLP